MGSSLIDQLRAGGFSESLAGKSPKTGYMTATTDRTEWKTKVEDVRASEIAAFARLNKNELNKDDNYLGGWLSKDKQTGQVYAYLDVSKNFQDRATTIQIAKAAKQIGIYDLEWDGGNGRTIYVNDPAGLYWLKDENIPNAKTYID